MLRILVALSATAVAVPLAAAPAAADPVVAGEFTVSAVGTNNQITQGPDANMWVTLDSAATNDVARIAPDGTVTEYNPAGLTDPVGIAAGPDGNLWVTQTGGVAKFSPGDPNSATATAIAGITDPRAITLGPDGNLWTASAASVFKIPAGNPGGFTPFPATGVAQARWIVSGTDGSLWVADGDLTALHVVRVTTAGVGTGFPTKGGPQGIAAGPNGQIAYSDPVANPQQVGRLTAPGPAVTTPTPLSDPFGVTFGNDGAYWIAQFGSNNLGRLTQDGQYSTLPLAANSGPRHLAAGPNNTLWVTLDTAEKVARVTGVDPPTPPTPSPSPTPTPNPAVDTQITKAPKKVVRTAKQRAKVKVRFTGTAGATFECRLAKKPRKPAAAKWRVCASPKVYRLQPGRYRFAVRAVTAQGKDGSPAKARFRVLRR